MRLRVETNIDEVAREWDRVAHRAGDLRPVGYMIRSRWHESERRTFAGRRGWQPRAASTLDRYRYPVRRWRRGGRRGRGRGPLRYGPMGPTGVYTGDLYDGLTKPQQAGVRDTINHTRGGLTATLGIKGKGPLAHGNLFQHGAGSRPAREVVVFDREAHDDTASDVLDHLQSFRRRSARRR